MWGRGGEIVPDGSGSVTAGPWSHSVQFYRGDGELAEGAGGFLADALACGGVAVVAATPAHLRLLEDRLAGLGADVAAARLAGAFVTVDAAEAVRRFTVAGQIDPAAFDTVIGQVIRAAAGGGRPVRVYGEMVALLWDAGHVNAALELEGRWNELGGQVPFALYCAYPERSVAANGHQAALAEVRRLHTEEVAAGPATAAGPVPGEPSASRTFPGDKASPRAARRFVLATLAGWRAHSVAGDAALVVTELATNAVLHARSRFTVSLAGRDGAVRISVADTRPSTGSPLPVSRGHGLGVVAAVAAAWGVQDTAGGKAVWAELRAL
jgi:hypothetical protein